MEEKQAGITALITAYARAYHATHDSPKIFDDYLADQMYTDEERTRFDCLLSTTLSLIDPDLAAAKPDQAAALAQVMQRHNGPITLSRSRFSENCLAEAIRGGVQQYVILGAGLDTFAFRNIGLMKDIQVFEIDHPVTQAMKHQRISMAGWSIPDHLHFIPVDFTKTGLAVELRRSAYDPRQLSFFSWLGVTYYLPEEALLTTLRDIASIAETGSSLVFDYLDADAFIPEKAGRRIRVMQQIAQQANR
jgi:methyltransferase (TIGR00027 family)